jgi:hypothetical protein
MKRFLTSALSVLALVALTALMAMAVAGRPASAASQYQYRGKPTLTISIVGASAQNYTVHVSGSGYFSGSQPGGQLQLTCGGKRGSTCGLPLPLPWEAGPVGPDGTFDFDYVNFDCGSNVKSMVAVDNNGVKSNSLKGAC